MANDYSKMKNDELQALLKQRSLPHTGKKADMVARLQEDDAKGSSTDAPAPASTSKEDEIDWDDGADASTEPAAAAVAAGGQERVDDPVAVPNQTSAEDPAKTDDLTASAPANGETEDAGAAEAAKLVEKPAIDFTSGLKQTTEVEELERRLARGKKFNTLSEEEVKDIEQKIERAKKFGTDNASKSLNEALPERPLGKRRREGGDDGGRGGKRRGGHPGRGAHSGARSGPPKQNKAQEATSGQGGWMSNKDREAAEKRKSRFAAPTAS